MKKLLLLSLVVGLFSGCTLLKPILGQDADTATKVDGASIDGKIYQFNIVDGNPTMTVVGNVPCGINLKDLGL